MTNEGQMSMMKNMLNSAAKVGFPMHLFHCYILNTHKEAATYNTVGFHNVTLKKLEVILENLRLDPEVFWIDNDIVLFENCLADVRAHPHEFVMQDDIWGPCTGFFLVRASSRSIRILEETIQWLRDRPNTHYNDQHAFSKCYKPKFGFLTYLKVLPQDEYPNGEIYFNQKRQSKAKMVHCNYLPSVVEKIDRFKEFGFWDASDAGFESVPNKYFI